MITLLMLLILWMPYLMKRLLSAAQQTRTPTKNASAQVPPKPPTDALSGTGSQDWQTWSTLDDRQLTRLLVDSAPPTTSEQDSV